MALDVTVGGASAESYASVAEAEAYLTARAVADSVFKSKGVPEKEGALRKATDYIDSYYKFKGTKNTDAQALQWPRADVEAFGYYVPADSIPQRVKRATIELAVKAIAGELAPDVSAQLVTAEQVGPLSVSYSDNQRNSGRVLYDLVDMLLEPYTGGRGQIPLVRA